MPGDSGVLVVTRVPSTTTTCTRDRGCSGHPAFPTPSKGAKHFINGSDALRRGITKDVGKPVDPIRYRLVGSRGSRLRAIVICPALEMLLGVLDTPAMPHSGVMRGLDPRIHRPRKSLAKRMGCRVIWRKTRFALLPGNDKSLNQGSRGGNKQCKQISCAGMSCTAGFCC